MSYYVYIIKCADKTLYTGFTNDLEKRVKTHNEGKAAAKYTRARRPVDLVYYEKFRTKSQAFKREWKIKQLRRSQKLALLNR
jgi:putative endonuclease